MINIINKKAFTLMEVLIALFISSFIMLGMIQIYRNVTKYIDKTRTLMLLNKKVCLLFDQMEKDIGTAFVPVWHDKNKHDKVLVFATEVYDGDDFRIAGKKWELFKSLSFVCSNPLQIYEQKTQYLVRVMYELVKDREKSFKDKTSYKLYRKETFDIKNYMFKEREDSHRKVKRGESRNYIVAENIKELSLEYMSLEKKDEREKRKEVSFIGTFKWDEFKKDEKKDNKPEEKKEEESFARIPKRVDLRINLWDEKLENTHEFECSVIIPAQTVMIKNNKKSEKVSAGAKLKTEGANNVQK